jgi:predicted dienelactone hydrolase
MNVRASMRSPWLSWLWLAGPCLAASSLFAVSAASGADPPSRFEVDAPELARPGPYAVGVRTLKLSDPAQPDVLAFDTAKGAPLRDRELGVELWYPAKPLPGLERDTYVASLPSEPPAPPANFSVSGVAVRGAPAAGRASAGRVSAGRASAGRAFPLVIVSHGYSNDPVAMTWLTENLASKGYVVAAIRHDDPPITDRGKFVGPALRRPLDIAFVARSLRRSLSDEGLIDPDRLALIGYSMGGYGVLAVGGAVLDPSSPLATMIPGGLLLPYASGGSRQTELLVDGLRAVVAISPAGGGTLAAFGGEGLRSVRAPLLLISGDADRTVNYSSGARAFFDQAVNSDRYLLTFKGAGHAIGLNPAPDSMREHLWDQNWFEDPVWRAKRVNAINAHFITAFLDRYLKDDETRASYLDVPVAESADGEWPAPPAPAPGPAYDAYSPGPPAATLWKGFQRSEAAGLELLHASPAASRR